MDEHGLSSGLLEGVGESSQSLREALLDTLRSLRVKTRADIVWFHRAASLEGRPRYMGIETVGTPAGAALKALEGEIIDREPVDLERPGRRMSGALIRAAVDPVLGPAHHRQVYGPAGLTHELSMLIYEGSRFIGRVIAVGGRRGFISSAPRYWNGIREAVSRFIRQYDTQRRQCVPVSRGTFVIDQSRRVEFGTNGAWAWLSMPDFRERFGQVSGPSDTELRLVGDAEVRVARMTNPGRAGLMVEVAPAAPVRLAPDGSLTPTQRKVAEFACEGATTQEIAATMEMSVETVRTHMREVYRRLEVASRVELAAKMRSGSTEAR